MSAPPQAAQQPMSPVNEAMQRALLVGGPATDVLLVRHGQQDYAPASASRAMSQDPPLSDLGRAQARATGRALRDLQPAVVVSSAMRRARETADLLAAELAEPAARVVREELREVEVFQQITLDTPTSSAYDTAELEQVAARFTATRRFDAFPTSEPSAHLRSRAVAAVEPLVADHVGELVVVVAHGGLINALLAELLGVETDMFFWPAHASITRAATADGRWVLRSLNETWQLRDGEHSLVTH